jgi:microcystin-dependent protein
MVIARSVAADGTGKPLTFEIYAQDPAPTVQMNGAAIGNIGGQPHANVMPYLTLNMCIALTGTFPGRPD